MDIEKQLGLGYLGRKPDGSRREEQKRSGTEQSTSLDPLEMLTSYGRPIMKYMATHGGTARLYSIIDNLQMPIGVALPCVEFLDREDFVEIVQQDLKGDHELRLTKRGRAMVE